LLAAPTIASLRIVGRYFYAKLFDLEPFPLVGPLALPSDEREAEAERLAAQMAPSQPITEAISKTALRARQRRQRAKENAKPGLKGKDKTGMDTTEEITK